MNSIASGTPNGIWRTHIPELDKMLGVTRAPWERKYDQFSNGAAHPVVLLRGAPGSGKTTLGLQIAANHLREQDGRPEVEKRLVIFLSLETKARLAVDAAKERLHRDLGKFFDDPKTFLTISRDELDNGFRKGDWPIVEKGLISFFQSRIAKRSTMLVFLDSLNIFADMTRNNIAQADQHYDMRAGIYQLWRMLRGNALFPNATFVSTGEHYASDQAHHHSLMSESFACDIEILLAAEPISGSPLTPNTEASALGYTIERSQVTDRKRPRSQYVEMRSFCRVLKSRYTPNQSRRCAYDILPNAGFVFKETFAGDGSVLLYEENSQQRNNWLMFLEHDIPNHFPALRYSLFDRPDKQRTFADQRQHLEFPPKIDVQLVCFDSYWPDWYLQLGRRTAINALLHQNFDHSFSPKPGEWHKDNFNLQRKIWSERLCAVDRLYAAALAKMHKSTRSDGLLDDPSRDIPEEFIFGSPIFLASDITKAFMQVIAKSNAEKSPGTIILEAKLSPLSRDLLSSHPQDTDCVGLLRDLLVDDLNKLLATPNAFSAQEIEAISPRPTTDDLPQERDGGRGLMRLNRLLIEYAVPCLKTRKEWDHTGVRLARRSDFDGGSETENDYKMLWDDLKSGRASVLRPLPRSKLRLFGERNSTIIAELLVKHRIPRKIEVLDPNNADIREDFYLSVPYNANVSFMVTREELLNDKRKALQQDQRKVFCDCLCNIYAAVEMTGQAQNLFMTAGSKKATPDNFLHYAEEAADRLSKNGELPHTWEEVIALCEMEPKQHMMVESRDLPSYMCFLHELIWAMGHDFVVTALYQIRQRQSFKEALFRALFLLSEMLAREIIKPNCSLVPTDYARNAGKPVGRSLHHSGLAGGQRSGSSIRPDWLFARHWHSTLIDFLSAQKEGEFLCPLSLATLSLSPLPFCLSAAHQYEREKDILGLEKPSTEPVRWNPVQVSCWGDWHFAIMRGSENDALGVEIINNLMSSHKIYERAISGAALPTVDAFYEIYGDLPCVQIEGREDIVCDMSYKRLRSQLFSCARTRNRVFDYQHCSRDLHSLLAKVTVMKRTAQPTLAEAIEEVLLKIEQHRDESMMIH
ncbi:MAG TPA: hypothetical protein VGO67_01085 [Verrucomicrobiae bacterium]|jgi:KaiC/GvpD/RAD55 family RecA-like ATPase